MITTMIMTKIGMFDWLGKETDKGMKTSPGPSVCPFLTMSRTAGHLRSHSPGVLARKTSFVWWKVLCRRSSRTIFLARTTMFFGQQFWYQFQQHPLQHWTKASSHAMTWDVSSRAILFIWALWGRMARGLLLLVRSQLASPPPHY